MARIKSAENTPGIIGKIDRYHAKQDLERYRIVNAKYQEVQGERPPRLAKIEDEFWITELKRQGPAANVQVIGRVRGIVGGGGEMTAEAKNALILHYQSTTKPSVQLEHTSEGSSKPPVLAAAAIGVAGAGLFIAGAVEKTS